MREWLHLASYILSTVLTSVSRTEYEKFHSTILSAVRPLTGKLYFWIADADALKDIWADRETFTKPIEVVSI